MTNTKNTLIKIDEIMVMLKSKTQQRKLDKTFGSANTFLTNRNETKRVIDLITFYHTTDTRYLILLLHTFAVCKAEDTFERLQNNPITFRRLGNFYRVNNEFIVEIKINLELIGKSIKELRPYAWQICSRENFCEHLETLNNAEEKLVELEMINNNQRQKRSALANALKSAFGIATEEDYQIIQAQIVSMNTRENRLIEKSKIEQESLHETFSQMQEISNFVQNLSVAVMEKTNELQLLTLRKDFAGKVEKNVETISKTVDRIINLVLNKKIQGNVIQFSKIENILESIRQKIQNNTMIPFKNALEMSKHVKAETSFKPGKLTATMKIPTVFRENYNLYKINIRPYMIKNFLVFITTEKKYLIAKEEKNISALIESIEKFTQVESRYLTALNTPDEINSSECIQRIFWTKTANYQECNVKTSAAIISDCVTVRHENEIFIFVTTPTNVSMKCENTTTEMTLFESSKTRINPGCQLYIQNKIFYRAQEEEIHEDIEIKINTIKNVQEKINMPKLKKLEVIHLEKLEKHLNELDKISIQTLSSEELLKIGHEQKIGMFAAIGSAFTSIFIMFFAIFIICCCIKI